MCDYAHHWACMYGTVIYVWRGCVAVCLLCGMFVVCGAVIDVWSVCGVWTMLVCTCPFKSVYLWPAPCNARNIEGGWGGVIE